MGNTVKNKKKKKNKTNVIIIISAIAVIIACAVVLVIALGGKSDGPKPDGTGEVTRGFGNGDGTGPADSAKDPDTVKDPASTRDISQLENTEEVGTVTPVIEFPDVTVFVTEGPVEDGDAWPADQIPEGIPEFRNVKKFYSCTYQQEDDLESWFMSWDADKSDYEAWMSDILAAGFYPSISIAYFYGNGEYIIDVENEENDDGTIWVSLDIYRSGTRGLPESMADFFPTIDTTATVYYVVDRGTSYDIVYQCAKDWEADLSGYIEKLIADGFTVSGCKAEKSVDGRTCVVEWGASGSERELFNYKIID